MHAFQAATGAAGFGGVNQSLNAAMVGDALPRGRGVDERAARAAAEVRKKAAARGLLLRPNAGPVQGLPPLSQILNVINSGITPDAVNKVETDGANKEVSAQPTTTPGDAQDDKSKPEQSDQTPVGLGSGLASLNAKKQKSKSKATS